MTRLWNIAPKSPGDFITNGFPSRDFAVPGVTCTACDSWAGMRILPFECPPDIREEVRDVYRHSPNIPFGRFEKLAQRWNEALKRAGHDATIQPGDDFAPVSWNVPIQPRCHIYWPNFTVLVHDILASALRHAAGEWITFTRAKIVKVGVARTAAELPEPDNEPEDVLDQVLPLHDLSQFGPFWEMSILADTRPTYRDNELPVKFDCEVCGFKRHDDPIAEKISRSRHKKARTVPRQYTPDAPIFCSHLYSGFIVKPIVYDCLTEAALANCSVREITAED